MQFRSDSVISHNIGPLHVTLAQVQDSNGVISLKNTLQVSFKGITISADDVNPAQLFVSNSQEPVPLMLLSWAQPTPLSCVFYFTDNTSITFSLSDDTQDPSLSISASIPKQATGLSLSYKPQSGYSVTEQTSVRQLLNSKKLSYVMTAPIIKETQFTLNNNSGLNLAIYNPKTLFTYPAVNQSSVQSLEDTYTATISAYRDLIVSSVTSAMHDISSLTETSVIAYVAEMGIRGKYTEAINRIPDSFKKGSKRTYLSAPFFNSLVTTNQSLVMANKNLSEMVANAIQFNSLDIFSVNMIAEYMLRENNSSIHSLVSILQDITDDQLTLENATGIINTYCVLAKASSPYAPLFTNAVEQSLKKIESAIIQKDDGQLILSLNEQNVSFIQSIETGSALREYGLLSDGSIYIACGNSIINSAFENEVNFDTRALSELYPVLIKDNTYYPHFEIIGKNKDKTIWAWTSASSIVYNENGSSATINISFKQGDTQYLIINNIKPFIGIDIYGMAFHTDPRFEIYNSSGYVYNANTNTLFLKSRHKSTVEQIKLTYSQTIPQPTDSEQQVKDSEGYIPINN